jgi:hypothetical protein
MTATTKKKTSKTHAVFILDRSGSMAELRKSVVTAFNEQVQQLRILADSEPTFASLVTFNGDVFEVRWKEDIKTFPEATMEDYMPAGSTSLYDAMGYTLSKLHDDDDGDTSFLIVVQSDGETWADCKFTESQVKALVKRTETTNRYTIVYIGCDPDVVRNVTRSMGLSVSNTGVYSTASAAAYGASAGNIGSAVLSYAMNKSADPSFTNTAFFCSATGDMGDFTKGVADPLNPVTLGGTGINIPWGSCASLLSGSTTATVTTITNGGSIVAPDPLTPPPKS